MQFSPEKGFYRVESSCDTFVEHRMKKTKQKKTKQQIIPTLQQVEQNLG